MVTPTDECGLCNEKTGVPTLITTTINGKRWRGLICNKCLKKKLEEGGNHERSGKEMAAVEGAENEGGGKRRLPRGRGAPKRAK